MKAKHWMQLWKLKCGWQDMLFFLITKENCSKLFLRIFLFATVKSQIQEAMESRKKSNSTTSKEKRQRKDSRFYQEFSSILAKSIYLSEARTQWMVGTKKTLLCLFPSRREIKRQTASRKLQGRNCDIMQTATDIL